MLPDESQRKLLLEQRNTLCVSMFFPLRVNAPHENLVRANNLMRQAEEKLAKVTCPAEATDFLRPVSEALRQQLEAYQGGRGMAVYASEAFHGAFELPAELPESVRVGRSFYIRPLLSFFQDDRFYILALSQKHARLFEANRFEARQVAVEGIPDDLQDVLYPGGTRELQFHASAVGAGKGPVVYHAGRDEPKDRFRNYMHELSNVLLTDVKSTGAPLVVAAVAYVASIYRETNPYSHLAERFVAGNPDLLKAGELRAKAWEIVAPSFEEEKTRALEAYARLGSRLASHNTVEILAAAREGRVRTLFLASDVIKAGADGEDELNQAACLTLLNGGNVHELPIAKMPEKTELAAMYRY